MHTIRDFHGEDRRKQIADSQPISRQTPYYRWLIILGSYLQDLNWTAIMGLGMVILGAWGTIELLRWIGK